MYWYCTEFKNNEGLHYAGPMILSPSQEDAQALADRILRSHDGMILHVLGKIILDEQHISFTYINKDFDINDLGI